MINLRDSILNKKIVETMTEFMIHKPQTQSRSRLTTFKKKIHLFFLQVQEDTCSMIYQQQKGTQINANRCKYDHES